ncbi:MAG: hypothetical protein ABSE93_14460 [Terriglobia bacterium]
MVFPDRRLQVGGSAFAQHPKPGIEPGLRGSGAQMTREEIRQEFIAYLRQALADRTKGGAIQLMELCQHLQRKVGYPAVRSVHQIARELLQEFVNNNVLFIGYGDAEGFPWFTVTEYGRKCIAEGNLLPFDPEGYLGALSKRVPGLDATALTYLREAISTYNRGFFLSSAVSLGVASEHLVLRLIDTYVNAHADPAKRAKVQQRFEGKFIFPQYSHFKKELDGLKASIPGELLKDYETHLDGVFNLIRLVRNQSGHPSGIVPDQAIVFANLQGFSFFAVRVKALEAHFASTTL